MQIDKNVPMPNATDLAREQRKGVIHQMEVGDSVLTEFPTRAKAAQSFSQTSRLLGLQHKYKSAMDGDKVRIWRVA